MAKGKNQNKLVFVFAVISMVIFACVGILFAIVLKNVIDSISNGLQDEFIKYVVILVAIVGVEFIAAVTSRYFALKFVRGKLQESKDRYYWYLINNNRIDENDNKDDLSQFSTNVDILYGNYYINKVLIVYYLSQFVLAILAVTYLNWIVCLVAFVTSAIPLMIPQICQSKVRSSMDEYSSSSKEYLDFINDSLLGKHEIKAYNTQETFFEKQSLKNAMVEYARSKSKLIIYSVNMVSSGFSSLTFLATIGISGYFVIKGNFTIGAMIAVIQLLNSMVSPLIQLSSAINEMNAAKNVVKQYDVEVYDDKNRNQSIESFNDGIHIREVSYSYDGLNPILDKLNLEFSKNKKYAITGSSGSGKSTLAKIISGEILDYSGKILIDGIDLKTVDLKSYRNICKHIRQQPYIFKDTIKNNIVFYGNMEDDMQEIVELFNLSKLVNEEGLKKIISNEEGISGGQKQRIILSRALLRKSPILILDEPTASLDHDNTKDIINRLIEIEGLTLIVITHEHDEELLKLFDEVIYMDGIIA